MISITNKLLRFNSSRYRLELENAQFAKSIPKGSIVLDAGCGEAPYRHMFNHTKYESADFMQSDRPYSEKITYVCDLAKIPVKKARFDYIICNQVLEHIPQPDLVMKELYRVLKPGGKILFTAPLFYQEHEKPFDFFRYTQFGWRKLLENAGLKEDKIEPLEGLFGLCGYFFEVTYYYLPVNKNQLKGKTGFFAYIIFKIIHPFIGLTAAFFHRLEKRRKLITDIGAKNYAVIAKKPN